MYVESSPTLDLMTGHCSSTSLHLAGLGGCDPCQCIKTAGVRNTGNIIQDSFRASYNVTDIWITVLRLIVDIYAKHKVFRGASLQILQLPKF